ncbi:MAG: modification methylase, partial [Candidatus Staskawiczbacteria bacterium]|nr:modification methylase [Candidatus Staskawiczbacteria bacterium]
HKKGMIRVSGVVWFTNLEIEKRHEDLIPFKAYKGNEKDYPKYDNYDAINVDVTKYIPMDYKGVMGVPITFLNKYNPGQFEIIKFRKGDDGKDLIINGKCPFFRILIKKKKVKK